MKTKTQDRIIDKGIDIGVVIIGILIALSINSYKERRNEQQQWLRFSTKVKADLMGFGEQYPKFIKKYNERKAKAEKLKKQFEINKIDKKLLNEVIQTMSSIDVIYPDSLIYETLISSGNDSLLSNLERLEKLGRFYSFEKKIMIMANVFIDHFFPKSQAFLKKYLENDKLIKNLEGEFKFLLFSHIQLTENFLKAFEQQEKILLKLKKSLK